MPWRVRTGTPFHCSDSQADSVESRRLGSAWPSPCSDQPALEDIPIDSRVFTSDDTFFGDPLREAHDWWNDDEFINQDFEIARAEDPGLGIEDEDDFREPLLPVPDATTLGARRVTHGPSISDPSFSQMMASVFASKTESEDLKFPWEKGFCKDLFSSAATELQFGDGSGLDWVPLENSSSLSTDPTASSCQDQVAGIELTGAFFEKVVLGLSDASFAEQLESKIDMAVSKWHCVLSYCLLASTTGRQIASAGDDETSGSTARRIIRAVLGSRSPNTAISRASSLLRFLTWCASEYPNTENPFYEEMAWRFACALQDGQSAATTGATFLSACRYAHHIFGFQLDTIIGSRRLAGVAEILYQEKRYLKQARVLTVQNIKWLHEQVANDSLADFDRAMFGYILVCVYGRCRHSDLSCVEDVTIDVGENIGFCEIRTSFRKTSRAAAQKATLLPIVMPALGVHGGLWPEEVKAAFERVGLVFAGKVRGPLLRPPKRAAHQGLCQRGIASSEITRLLRLCFDQRVPADAPEAERVSSHSLKATALSWAAKFGVDPRTQSLLGRHSSLARDASTVYCRDTAIRATSALCEVISAINEGRFFPDAPRSLYRLTLKVRRR